jgi:hypothetical protein
MMKMEEEIYNTPVPMREELKYRWFVFGYDLDNYAITMRKPPNLFIRLLLKLTIGSDFREVVYPEATAMNIGQYKPEDVAQDRVWPAQVGSAGDIIKGRPYDPVYRKYIDNHAKDKK